MKRKARRPSAESSFAQKRTLVRDPRGVGSSRKKTPPDGGRWLLPRRHTHRTLLEGPADGGSAKETAMNMLYKCAALALSCSLWAGCGDDGNQDGMGGAGTGGTGTGGTGTAGGGTGGTDAIGGGGGEAPVPPTCDVPQPPELGLGGAGGFGGAGSGSLEIAGTWEDDFGTTHEIDSTAVKTSSEFGSSSIYLTQIDESAQWAIGLNAQENGFNPCLYSRFEWHWEASELYVCQSVFMAGSETAAENAPMADSGDLDGGCGSFSWSKLTAK